MNMIEQIKWAYQVENLMKMIRLFPEDADEYKKRLAMLLKPKDFPWTS